MLTGYEQKLQSQRYQTYNTVGTVVSLVNAAVNMTLPAFAAERRAAAPLLLDANIDLCPASGALSSKPAVRRSGY